MRIAEVELTSGEKLIGVILYEYKNYMYLGLENEVAVIKKGKVGITVIECDDYGTILQEDSSQK